MNDATTAGRTAPRRTRVKVESQLARMAAGTVDPPAEPVAAAAPATAAPVEAAVPHNPDAKEGEEYPGEPTIKIGTVLPVGLKGQLDGLVRFAQDTGDVEGITTAVDVFRIALHRYILEAQKEHNGGEPFRAPSYNRRGRPVRPR
ncbi:MAG TPA: hypothetical protein VFC16_16355 [Nakamurella sp.]|jgi:hypothetical protein|nr:hypothetical protein [Nakamurella sp.]